MKKLKIYISLFFFPLICSSEEPLIVRDITKPMALDEMNTINKEKNCQSLVKDYFLKITDDSKKYFIDDPVSYYSSIKEIKIKGTKLEITLEQRKELLQYESPIQISTPVLQNLDGFKELDGDTLKKCESFLKEKKEINFASKKATGKSGWAKNSHPEKLSIIGFENPITILASDKGWKLDGSTEVELEEKIKISAKANSVLELTVKCLTCKNTKSEIGYPDELENPVTVKKVTADFRFVKNQMMNGE